MGIMVRSPISVSLSEDGGTLTITAPCGKTWTAQRAQPAFLGLDLIDAVVHSGRCADRPGAQLELFPEVRG